MTSIESLGDIEILALTMIGEARGEAIQGIIAVGCVIRNRTKQQKKSYSEICLAPKQFSCWNEDDPNRIILEELADKMVNGQNLEEPIYKQIVYLAAGIHEGFILDNTNGAINYLTVGLFFSPKKPSWAKDVKNLKTIGNQVFFNA